MVGQRAHRLARQRHQVQALGDSAGEVDQYEPQRMIWPDLIVTVGNEEEDGDLPHAAAKKFEQI
jgi:hypothetical protein